MPSWLTHRPTNHPLRQEHHELPVARDGGVMLGSRNRSPGERPPSSGLRHTSSCVAAARTRGRRRQQASTGGPPGSRPGRGAFPPSTRALPPATRRRGPPISKRASPMSRRRRFGSVSRQRTNSRRTFSGVWAGAIPFRVALEDRRDGVVRGFAREERPRGQHLVPGAAERPDVGPLVDPCRAPARGSCTRPCPR